MQCFHFILLLLLHVFLVEGKNFLIRKDRLFDCEFRGYVPGGKVTDVGKIEAPVAEMAKNGLVSVFSPITQASGLAGGSLDLIKGVAGAFAKVAPILGPVLGIFGAPTGIFKSMTETKPKDILNAVNSAMGDLTKDMNDKIEEMEGYVESKIITNLKELIDREYRTIFNFWVKCVDEASKELADECQRDAYKKLSANRTKFAVFDTKLKGKEALNGSEAREMEAYLVPFRNYANLVVMVLKPLIETYENDTTKVGQCHFNRYTKAMKKQMRFFRKYAVEAVRAIERAHEQTDENGVSAGVCPKTIDCGTIHPLHKEGVFKGNTANDGKCSCIIDDGTKQKCSVSMTIRVDSIMPDRYYNFDYPCKDPDECVLKEHAKHVLIPLAEAYTAQNTRTLELYWEKELFEFVPVWKKAFLFAKEKQKKIVENGGDGVRSHVTSDDSDSDEVEYSPRFADRLKKAERRTKEQTGE